MAAHIRASAGWIAEKVHSGITQAIASTRVRSSAGEHVSAYAQGSYLEDASGDVTFDGEETCIRFDVGLSNLYAQILSFASEGPRILLDLSDSKNVIRATLSSESVQRFNKEKKGRSITKDTAGAVLLLKNVELVVNPSSPSESLHLMVGDFRYYGVCSIFGAPTSIKSLESMSALLACLKQSRNGEQPLSNSKYPSTFSPGNHNNFDSPKPLVNLGSQMPALDEGLLLSSSDASMSSANSKSKSQKAQNLMALFQANGGQLQVPPPKTLADVGGSAKEDIFDSITAIEKAQGAANGDDDAAPQNTNDDGLSQTPEKMGMATRLSELEPDDCYVFKRNFNFTKYVPKLSTNPFLSEQIRLLNLPEAAFLPKPGVKFAESNFPVEAVNHMRATAQKRAAYHDGLKAKRMQEELRLQNLQKTTSLPEEPTEDDLEAEPSSEVFIPWSPSPEPESHSRSSLPPDSSPPENLPKAVPQAAKVVKKQTIKLDSDDDASDLEMQEPLALEPPAFHSNNPQPVTVPSKRAIESSPIRPTTSSTNIGHGIFKRQRIDPEHRSPPASASSDTPGTLPGCFERFKQVYPHYAAEFKHFSSLISQARKHWSTLLSLEAEQNVSVLDDFIIRHLTEYVPYSGVCLSEGETPIPYIEFYRSQFHFAENDKGVLSAGVLGPLGEQTAQPLSSYRHQQEAPATGSNDLPEWQPVDLPIHTPTKRNTILEETYDIPSSPPFPIPQRLAVAVEPEKDAVQTQELALEPEKDVLEQEKPLVETHSEIQSSLHLDTVSDSAAEDQDEPQPDPPWWHSHNAPFKEFARGYGKLKSFKGSLGKVLGSDDTRDGIFEQAIEVDFLSWDVDE